MRARLNKLQMQLLLDGGSIHSPKRRFSLPDDKDSEVRIVLQKIVDSDELREKAAVFLDMDNGTIVLEDNK